MRTAKGRRSDGMSLLLDALKKAEKAKDEAKRRAQEPDAATDGARRHVRTRDELPDISQPLEIHSEDIPGPATLAILESPPDPVSTLQTGERSTNPGELSSPSLERAADQTPRRRQTTRPVETGSNAQAAERAAAKNVFEAKFREPNPKLPFYITMAVLGLLAVGTGVYFWFELRSPPTLVNTNPKPPSDEKRTAVAEFKPAIAAQPAAPATAQPSTIPGLLPQPSVVQGPAASPAAAPAAAASAPAAGTPAPAAPGTAGPAQVVPTPPAPAPRAAKPAASAAAPVQARRDPAAPPRQQSTARAAGTPPDPSKLSVNRAALQVNPKLEAGWLAYNQGNLPAARSNYLEVLREESTNRDALLGMAALEVRAHRLELAEIYYQKLLDADPRDAHAQAGLFALRAQMTDPVQTESRVKSILASDPQAHVLYFTLGNQYAQQGRWPEAQLAYFKAFSADPENPDFAYNLAVSLDHIKQPKQALEYYRRAIALAQQRSSNFDQALARNRVQELAR